MIKAQQLLMISSANRLTGTPSDFTVSLPNGMLYNEYGGRTKITVVDTIINRCFWSVRDSNNDFRVVRTNSADRNGFIIESDIEYRIPVGNYSIQSWMVALQALLPAWSFAHNSTNGLCTFRPPLDGWSYGFRFSDKSSYLLGFHPTDEPWGTNRSPIISDFPLRLNIESFLNIHHSFPRLKNSSVANYKQTEVRENDVLIRLPVNVPSFANIIFQNINDDWSFYIASSHVNQLRLYVTDEHRDSITPFPYDWSLTLRIDIYSNDEPMTDINKKLDSINEKLSYLALK